MSRRHRGSQGQDTNTSLLQTTKTVVSYPSAFIFSLFIRRSDISRQNVFSVSTRRSQKNCPVRLFTSNNTNRTGQYLKRKGHFIRITQK